MESTLVAFGTLEPTLQIQIVCRHISQLAPDKQPWLKTVHYCGKMLVHRVSTGLPVLPQRVKQRRSRSPRGFVAGLEGAVDGLEVLDVCLHLCQRLTCHLQSGVNTASQMCQQRLCRPPFFARRLRSSESRTSCNASRLRKPGGCNGPPGSSLRMPRTAARYPSTTAPTSSW